MSDKKSWDGRFPGESNEMYQWRMGVHVALAALAHSIRIAPGADMSEADKFVEHSRNHAAPKDKDSIEHLAFMSPLIALLGAQAYTPDGEEILTDTRKKNK